MSMTDRFTTAATGEPPTADQSRALGMIYTDTVILAETIAACVPAGRDRSIALTTLEDVLMRANRGVFASE